jgi:hypothetical protein
MGNRFIFNSRIWKTELKQKGEEMNIDDIKYLRRGSLVVKCVVEEIITRQTREKLIKKIIVRPYGIKDFITVDAEDIFDTLEEAKEACLEEIERTYVKENIQNNYEQAITQTKEKFEKALAEFDANYDLVIKTVKNRTEEYFDDFEKEYQEKKSQEKSVE